MLIKFKPRYTITPSMASLLLRIQAVKEKIGHSSLTPRVLASLRETARLATTHYSTMIEGNQLELQQVKQVIKYDKQYAGSRGYEREVKGYYTALHQVEQWALQQVPVTEKLVQTLHALVMAGGVVRVKPTLYRDGQNVIRESQTKAIVYMPPQSSDVPGLMHGLMQWLADSADIPCPLVAGIAHYQFATIHPYYDGNGRTARLLATLLLHRGGYDLKGLYSLEEYYAQRLGAYYSALSLGPSHNYYMGRAKADITPWLEYFIQGMANSCERVLASMNQAKKAGKRDQADVLRQLDPKQRKALELFCTTKMVTARQIGQLFGFQPRTSAHLCKKWVDEGFLIIKNPSNKGRTYCLAHNYEKLMD